MENMNLSNLDLTVISKPLELIINEMIDCINAIFPPSVKPIENRKVNVTSPMKKGMGQTQAMIIRSSHCANENRYKLSPLDEKAIIHLVTSATIDKEERIFPKLPIMTKHNHSILVTLITDDQTWGCINEMCTLSNDIIAYIMYNDWVICDAMGIDYDLPTLTHILRHSCNILQPHYTAKLKHYDNGLTTIQVIDITNNNLPIWEVHYVGKFASHIHSTDDVISYLNTNDKDGSIQHDYEIIGSLISYVTYVYNLYAISWPAIQIKLDTCMASDTSESAYVTKEIV